MEDLVELLKQVRELELIARKNAYSLLAGDYTTTVAGSGMMFHEARKYVFGESIRMIDWNMTARLGEPYVKVHLEERQREVFIALDISSSMHTGWMDKTKIEYAVELAATLAVSSLKSRDKLGYILFTDQVVEMVKPSLGKLQLFRTLKAFVSAQKKQPPKHKSSDIRSAIHAIQQQHGKKFIIFMISDFMDKDIPDDLKYLRAIHDLTMLHVYDPLEYTPTPEIMIPAYSPEGMVNDTILSPGETGGLEEMMRYLKDIGLSFKIAHKSFSTKDPVDTSLKELFHIKQRLRR